MQKHHELED